MPLLEQQVCSLINRLLKCPSKVSNLSLQHIEGKKTYKRRKALALEGYKWCKVSYSAFNLWCMQLMIRLNCHFDSSQSFQQIFRQVFLLSFKGFFSVFLKCIQFYRHNLCFFSVFLKDSVSTHSETSKPKKSNNSNKTTNQIKHTKNKQAKKTKKTNNHFLFPVYFSVWS